MSAPRNHCPFLNRADDRCSKHFSLDRLDRAFGDCFGEYASCAVYSEMLAERRERRLNASLGRDGSDAATPVIQVTFHGRPGIAHRQSISNVPIRREQYAA